MTPDELQSWRARMGYTHIEAAKALGMSLDSFRTRVYGRTKVSRTVAKLCDALEMINTLDQEMELLSLGENY